MITSVLDLVIEHFPPLEDREAQVRLREWLLDSESAFYLGGVELQSVSAHLELFFAPYLRFPFQLYVVEHSPLGVELVAHMSIPKLASTLSLYQAIVDLDTTLA